MQGVGKHDADSGDQKPNLRSVFLTVERAWFDAIPVPHRERWPARQRSRS